VEALQNVPLLKVLDESERSFLLTDSNVLEIPRYDYVYLEEDTTDKIYFLLEGMVKISTRSESGREAIKAILHDHEMFGGQGLSGQTTRQEFVIAMLDGAKILEVNLETLRAMMKKNYQLCQKIIEFMGEKLRTIEQRLEAQIFLNAKDRIIDFIRESVIRRGKRVGFDHFLKRSLTQQEIANYTGTSRQTVTEVFNELKKSNLIYFNRSKILIREQFNLECD
jgi:CRP-like cAMP-binding protein